ncbi:MAG: hypothetical protein K2J82_07835 [Muribaculaceae bacterium]|nr:hypothetical protein [Muribaculaceae bacterium]
MLTLADVDRLSLHPCLRTDLLGYLLEGLVAVFAEIIDDDILGPLHLSDLPIRNISQAIVHAFDNHGHVLMRRSGEGEHRVILIIHSLDHEESLEHTLHSVELHVIDPFLPGILSRTVFLRQPESLPLEIDIIIDIQGYMVIMGEGEREDTVPLYLLYLCRTVIRRQFPLRRPC